MYGFVSSWCHVVCHVLQDSEALIDELMTWLHGAESNLVQQGSAVIPDNIPIVEQLLHDHSTFQTEIQVRGTCTHTDTHAHTHTLSTFQTEIQVRGTCTHTYARTHTRTHTHTHTHTHTASPDEFGLQSGCCCCCRVSRELNVFSELCQDVEEFSVFEDIFELFEVICLMLIPLSEQLWYLLCLLSTVLVGPLFNCFLIRIGLRSTSKNIC